jgi:hypothetical protein
LSGEGSRISPADLPSGDSLAQDFQRFLKEQGDDK